MDGFFEKYGRMIVIAVVICFVLLYLTPMRNVVGSSINGFAGNFANKVGDSLGTVKMPDGSDGTTNSEGVKVGDTLDIEGTEYIVLEERENNQALVMAVSAKNSSGGRRVFSMDSLSSRSDGQKWNTYEGSEIDNYLENEWYNGLSSTMKTAIQPINIKQTSQYDNSNPISRHIFLPSVREVEKIVDLKDEDKSDRFLTDDYYNPIWVREKSDGNVGSITILYSGYSNPSIVYTHMSGSTYYVRPAFVINLSQVEYKVIGHTDYK